MDEERGKAGEPCLDGALGRLLDLGHRITPHQLPTVIEEVGVELGAQTVRIWLADIQHRELVLLGDGAKGTPREVLAIEGTAAGRAFTSDSLVVREREGGGTHLWLPLLDGVDRVGILELEVEDLDEGRRVSFCRLATIVTAEILSRGHYTDQITVTRRRGPMSLAAELQWQALPPSSFSAADVTVAAMVEPAYETGGDTYDYAHQPNGLGFSVLDAVGHDLGATLVSTLALGAYRNQRRLGADLATMGAAMDEAIVEQIGDAAYATGQLAHLDTTTGLLRFLNAGHPLPLLIRGGKVIGPIACPPRLPFGLGHLRPDAKPCITEIHLEPMDAVLLYTDGVIEARTPHGTDFGIDRLDESLQRAFAADLPLAETVRRLSNAVIDHHKGQLDDDATNLLVRWHPQR
ncbi:MAG: PP2C family protein-serine/threonine phosphatase [Acidimicrobiales bacterium]